MVSMSGRPVTTMEGFGIFLLAVAVCVIGFFIWCIIDDEKNKHKLRDVICLFLPVGFGVAGAVLVALGGPDTKCA
jgi:hypothetical protein